MIILFSGIPGSGKTTIAKILAKRLKKFGRVKIFISDNLRPPVYEHFFRLLRENLGRADFLIFDATFYKKKWRDGMRRLTRGEKTIIIFVKCRLTTAIERNKKRRAGIPERAVHIIYHEMEPPPSPSIVINTEKIKPDDAVRKILGIIKL